MTWRTNKLALLLCLQGVVACESRDQPAEASARSEASAPKLDVAAAASAHPVVASAQAGALPSPSPQTERPTSIAAQHVLIAYRGAERAERSVKRTKEAARKLAQTVVDEARAGADFSELVKKYSEDPGAKERLGSLGKFTPDKMHKQFSEAAFALRVNQVSEVVETPFGFHIIKRNQ